jgi:hypothetical protein
MFLILCIINDSFQQEIKVLNYAYIIFTIMNVFQKSKFLKVGNNFIKNQSLRTRRNSVLYKNVQYFIKNDV